MSLISLVFHSGYGHTKKQANAVAQGLKTVDETEIRLIEIDQQGEISSKDWLSLNTSDAIVFGSPTYMGSVSWQFKKFADTSSKVWGKQLWKDKFAAGFTNSASLNGDKGSTLNYLFTFSMQHSMLWIGTGLMPANAKSSTRNDVNYLGSFSGLMAQSPSDSSIDEGPTPGDLETARLFGKRFAMLILNTQLSPVEV